MPHTLTVTFPELAEMGHAEMLRSIVLDAARAFGVTKSTATIIPISQGRAPAPLSSSIGVVAVEDRVTSDSSPSPAAAQPRISDLFKMTMSVDEEADDGGEDVG